MFPYCMASIVSHPYGEIALDISIRIRTHFESDRREQWEFGQELFQQEAQGVRFWLDVQEAIRIQAKRMGVPARKLQMHDIVLKMDNLVVDLQSLEIPISKDGTKKIPPFVAFMRHFEPKEDSTWDIWKYVLDKRIKPALVRGSDNTGSERGMSLDPDNNPPVAPNADLTDDRELTHITTQLEILKNLNPIDQAIYLMTTWSLQTQAEKDIYRPVIIQTGAKRCYERGEQRDRFPSVDAWAIRNSTLFCLAEEELRVDKSNDRVRAVELQESISLHYHGAIFAEQAKSKFVERFLSQGGVRELVPVSNASADGAVSFAVKPLNPTWQTDAKALLLKICQQAARSKHKDKFREQFYADYPLTDIYKDYKPKQGAPKHQNNALWMLMRFGDNCQSQSYHLKAYRSKESEFSQMKGAIGFSDHTIGEVLGMRAGTVAVRRNRYRAELRDKLPSLNNQVPDRAGDEEIRPTIDVVCSDYES